jgi:hypothetical protein
VYDVQQIKVITTECNNSSSVSINTEVVTAVVNNEQGYNTMRVVTVIKLLLNCLLIKHNNYVFGELTYNNDQLLHTPRTAIFNEYKILPILNPLKTVHFQPP